MTHLTSRAAQPPQRRTRMERRRLELARKRRWAAVRKVALRAALCVVSALLFVILALLGAIYIIERGPSETAGDLFVTSVMETSALKFVAGIFNSDEQVQAILARNTIVRTDEETDTSLVTIATPTPVDETGADAGDDVVDAQEDIIIEDVVGATYAGKMMIVKDPSRIAVGLCNDNLGSGRGKTLAQIVKQSGAVAGVNGGAFSDENGSGNGGTPDGIVIKDGKALWTKKFSGNAQALIGITYDDKLYLTYKLDAKAAIKHNVRDAVTFGPILVHNGEAVAVKGASSGFNPRTAIGQRADGAVLLLVIDGRKVNSVGATLNDLIDVMMQYGAVNAANLDGGSSSYLYYDGEYVNEGSSLTGPRNINTAILVY